MECFGARQRWRDRDRESFEGKPQGVAEHQRTPVVSASYYVESQPLHPNAACSLTGETSKLWFPLLALCFSSFVKNWAATIPYNTVAMNF